MYDPLGEYLVEPVLWLGRWTRRICLSGFWGDYLNVIIGPSAGFDRGVVWHCECQRCLLHDRKWFLAEGILGGIVQSVRSLFRVCCFRDVHVSQQTTEHHVH